jgi:hypothetical protein
VIFTNPPVFLFCLLVRRVSISDTHFDLCLVVNSRKDYCFWCAGTNAHQEEGWGESEEEGCAAMSCAVTYPGACSAGKQANVICRVALIMYFEQDMLNLVRCCLFDVALKNYLVSLCTLMWHLTISISIHVADLSKANIT